MIAPTLESERLLLRPLTTGDAAELTQIINDYEISKWLAVIPYPCTIIHMLWFISSYPNALRFGVEERDSGRLIGVVYVGEQFGYWLGRDYWGNGYMLEAARCALDYWFDEGNDALLTSYIEGNERSRAILEALGFQDTSVATGWSEARESDMPLQRMALTRQLWLAHKAD